MSVEENTSNNKPLVVIVGPTASGKSVVGMAIARQYGGEIICADSRTIYKGMDIGTAKPSGDDRREVPHWGLDLVEPGDRFTAADFKQYALQKIDEIRSRGNLPLIVGGTGLYVDGVLFDYAFAEADAELRRSLEDRSLEELLEYCNEHNITPPENEKNKRYVIRAIEQNGINNKRKQELKENTFVVGIATDTDVLRQKIAARIDTFFEDGVVDEAKVLAEKYGWDSEAMTGNIYPLIHRYLEGDVSMEELKEKVVTADWRLAKRQRTWFKRNPYIRWVSNEEAVGYIAGHLL